MHLSVTSPQRLSMGSRSRRLVSRSQLHGPAAVMSGRVQRHIHCVPDYAPSRRSRPLQYLRRSSILGPTGCLSDCPESALLGGDGPPGCYRSQDKSTDRYLWCIIDCQAVSLLLHALRLVWLQIRVPWKLQFSPNRRHNLDYILIDSGGAKNFHLGAVAQRVWGRGVSRGEAQ